MVHTWKVNWWLHHAFFFDFEGQTNTGFLTLDRYDSELVCPLFSIHAGGADCRPVPTDS